MYQEFERRDTQTIQTAFDEQVALINQGVGNHISEAILALQRMADRWESSGGTPFEQWQDDAQNYVTDFEALNALEWVDEDYIIRWIEPMAGNEAALGLNIAFEEERRKALVNSAQKGKTTITPPLDLVQGYRGMIIYIPLFIDQNFGGFLVAIYNTDSFISSYLPDEFAESFDLHVSDSGKTVFQTPGFESFNTRWHNQSSLSLLEREWTVAIGAKEHFVSEHHSHVALVTFIGGLLTSLLLGFVIYSFLISRQKNRILERQKLTLTIRENEKNILLDRLAYSNEELTHFAYICSHDLQEPLRMIRSFSQKLKTHMGEALTKDPKGDKYFTFIMDGAERAQILIQDILSYSKIDQSTEKIERVDLNEIVSLIKDNTEGLLKPQTGVISSEPLPFIEGNKTQLYQLFQNLINNGLKYQVKGATPTIDISAVELEKTWQISISDNGIGISAKYQNQIFDVFKRLHRRTEYAGTGIGLAICKKVVERHGGDIWVNSEEGQGATFTFTLQKENTNPAAPIAP